MGVSDGVTPLSELTSSGGTPAQQLGKLFGGSGSGSGALGGGGTVLQQLEKLFGGSGGVNSWIERGVILLVGLLLIAAGFFTHPAIRETVVSTAKKAGEVAALAA